LILDFAKVFLNIKSDFTTLGRKKQINFYFYINNTRKPCRLRVSSILLNLFLLIATFIVALLTVVLLSGVASCFVLVHVANLLFNEF